MGAVTAELAKRQMEAEPLMVPGFGALPVVPPKYVAANDNVAGGRTWPVGRAGVGVGAAPIHASDPQTAAAHAAVCDDLATTTFAPLADLPVPVASQPARRGDWLQTYTGRKFWSMDPRAGEVHIEDIAHALSMQCRYAGHCLRFYSVAEHSIHIAWWLYRHAGAVTALQGLLHDASEAYLVDVPRPVKPYLAGYKDAESKVQAAVMTRFGLPAELPRALKEADDRIIGDEIVNMKPMDWHARYNNPLGVALAYWSPAEAEAKFLASFEALMEEVRGMAV